jgi:hypothetical protein
MESCWPSVQPMSLTIRGLTKGRDKKLFSSPKRPDRLAGPPSRLFSEYRRFLSLQVKRGGGDVNSSTCLHPARKSRINGFQASAAMLMRSTLFWDITQCQLVKLYRRFGATHRSHLQESRTPKRKRYPRIKHISRISGATTDSPYILS